MFGVGKYKARYGQDVEIVAVVGDVAIGYIHNNPKAANTWEAKTGRFFIDSKNESAYDLIDPNAKRPIKQELWLTLYKSDCSGAYAGGGYATLQQAKEYKNSMCIAIAKVTIDCMEGDNLD